MKIATDNGLKKDDGMPTEQVVVLGAGKPHRGETPTVLRTYQEGTSVLEWLLDAIGGDTRRVTLVGGFGVESIRLQFPDLEIVVPAAWQQSGSAASLLSAPLEADRDLLVVYGDVLVRPDLISSVLSGSGDITIAWDSAWRSRFVGRRLSDLAGREKVLLADGLLMSASTEIEFADASGEFIGLVRLSADVVRELISRRSDLLRLLPRQAHLSNLVDVLRSEGWVVDAVDAQGDWAEVHDPADIARFVLGTKADSLARLGRLVRRSQVPPQITRTVAEWSFDPKGAIQQVINEFGDRKLIVRSSTSHEDTFMNSNAGGFTSVLGVSSDEGLLSAVEAVASSYRDAGIDAEVQQVLVQPLVENVKFSGVVLTRTLDRGAPWIVVQYADGADTERVTSGFTNDTRTLFVHRKTSTSKWDFGLASREIAMLSPVLDAVSEVEQLLNYEALDIEFAVDKSDVIHLLQVRPMVVPMGTAERDARFDEAIEDAKATWDSHAKSPAHLPGDNRLILGVMPDWNPAEIIGTAPGQLALDLYGHLVTDRVWADQRAQVGYRDVRPAPLLIDVAGRPYVDVRASFASFLPATLDDRLAGRLLGSGLERLVGQPWLHDKVEFEVVPTCIDPNWPRWERILAADGFQPEEITNIRKALERVTQEILGRVTADLQTVQGLAEATRTATHGVSDPLLRAGILLDLATRLGALPFAHLARAAFVAVSMLDGACADGIIDSDAVAGFHTTVRTVSGDLTFEAAAVTEGRLSWTDFVEHWGHLRPGTYDLTSPRYDVDPGRFLRPLLIADRQDHLPSRKERNAWQLARKDFGAALGSLGVGLDTDDWEDTLRRAIEGREWAKLAFSRNLSDALEAIAEGWESFGVDRATLRDVPLSLLLRNSEGRTTDTGRVREAADEGRQRRELAEAMPLQPLLTDRRDLDAFVTFADIPNFVGIHPVTAPAVELDGAKNEWGSLNGRIVMIPRADPGFDWIFGHGIAGLITVYGGANSHMAIRAAEHGLAAAIGIGPQRYEELRKAMEIEIDPCGRTLRSLR